MIALSDANNYFQNERLFSDKWFDLDMNKQEQALNMATNQINSIILNRRLEKEDDYKKAVCEQALYLIENQNSNRSKLIEQGVTSFSVEGLSESYDAGKIKSNNKVCSEAMQYLKKYMTGGYAIC
ncbi:MAG TPA: hypothetical protein DDY58_17280 [Terrisporobacter glycolicus]|uniref:hypothetical protein n=1 Tax=Terrisporobacter TaxID=1505652 RepID=UPI000E8C73DC|nr:MULTISPECIES: hypothetical protein [Terrisporobacter]HBI94026.1 hypothetical protein [Terrisporobacter hibernicus]